MREYTENERMAIDAAYGKMGRGETMAPEEMQLIISFEREKAADEALASLQAEQIQHESEARIKASAEQAAIARENLILKRKRAQAEYAASVEKLESIKAARKKVENEQK